MRGLADAGLFCDGFLADGYLNDTRVFLEHSNTPNKAPKCPEELSFQCSSEPPHFNGLSVDNLGCKTLAL
eukprot:1382701-Amphidinium_carterae.1